MLQSVPATIITSDWRGLARGAVYDATGRLVASTAQEGLLRVLPA